MYTHLLASAVTLCLARSALSASITDDQSPKINPSKWNAAISAPNATGAYPIRGFNISGPYSEEELPGWTMVVRVAVDRETGAAEDDEDHRTYFAGTSISIKAPDTLLETDGSVATVEVSQDPEWNVQVFPTVTLSGDILDDAQNDDGSCLSFLSEQCVKDWQDAYVSSDVGWASPPSSCNKTLQGTGPLRNNNNNTVPLSMFNGTKLISYSTTYSDLGHGPLQLQNAVRQIVPVMMVYRQSGQNGTASEAARLSCVRARDLAGGSKLATGVANTSTALSRWALAPFILAALLLL
ncbi:Uu.00g062610.m01.CDS01 [Anthostomella pinea]|uniref:Uu.00g062610.m01.CDS01 n=1 Tax=Anthostomella pinea TaxID=933095 RepID=A0AAI8VT74_9PEZI|nr:Uu.00g062610.m01.CDS01 [Anthostomella pinea]